MLGRIAAHTEEGLQLQRLLVEMVGSWPSMDDFGRRQCPDESRAKADELLTGIQRWFNSTSQMIRGSLLETTTRTALERRVRVLVGWGAEGRFPPPHEVQATFAIAFSALAALPEDWGAVDSVAGPKDRAQTVVVPNTAFVLMWMDRDNPELKGVLETIKAVFKQFGIAARRADDIEHQDVITDLVLQQVRTSEFLVADLTGARPNVYYEVGYAHACGKRPILFRRAGTPLQFDLSVHNVPEYDSLADLRELLTRRLEAITGRQAS